MLNDFLTRFIETITETGEGDRFAMVNRYVFELTLEQGGWFRYWMLMVESLVCMEYSMSFWIDIEAITEV